MTHGRNDSGRNDPGRNDPAETTQGRNDPRLKQPVTGLTSTKQGVKYDLLKAITNGDPARSQTRDPCFFINHTLATVCPNTSSVRLHVLNHNSLMPSFEALNAVFTVTTELLQRKKYME